MRTKIRLVLVVSVLTCMLLLLLGTHIFSIPLHSKHTLMRSPVGVIDTQGMNKVEPFKLDAKVLERVQAEVEKVAKHEHFTGTQEQRLTRAFQRCDSDASNSVSLPEAVSCIRRESEIHLNQAIRENFFIFTAVDLSPRNGVVTWAEYVTYYLRQCGYDQHFVDAHLDSLKGLKRTEKEEIMRAKASWSEAAQDPDHLTLDEFLGFRHPETSHATILAGVEELMAVGDAEGDEKLTRKEYRAAGGSDHEFGEIDANKDGELGRRELLLYRDPRHSHHAEVEAAQLFAVADSNKDGAMTLSEILVKAEVFIRSKMVDAAKNFHNEV